MSKSKANNVNKGPTSLYPEFRSKKLGPMEPLIRIDRRFTPPWISWFTLLITFAWLVYGIYIRIEPAFDGPSNFERYVDRKFPELDVSGPENNNRPPSTDSVINKSWTTTAAHSKGAINE